MSENENPSNTVENMLQIRGCSITSSLPTGFSGHTSASAPPTLTLRVVTERKADNMTMYVLSEMNTTSKAPVLCLVTSSVHFKPAQLESWRWFTTQAGCDLPGTGSLWAFKLPQARPLFHMFA